MQFKIISSCLYLIFASILLIPNVMFGYELGVEKKVEDKKPRVNLTVDDFEFILRS